MKGRRAPPAPEIAALINKAAPLTMADIEALLDTHMQREHMKLPATASERMPEPTPYERGALDRYQDRKRRGKR